MNHPSGDGVTKTAFTQLVASQVEARSDRPGLLFSSTSWTQDEDFGILMKALEGKFHYHHHCQPPSTYCWA